MVSFPWLIEAHEDRLMAAYRIGKREGEGNGIARISSSLFGEEAPKCRRRDGIFPQVVT